MSSQILIAALKKVINRDVSSVVLAALKELVLGYWYSERKDENESYLDYWTRVLKSSDEENVGEDVEDDNEYVETKVAKKERKIAPKDRRRHRPLSARRPSLTRPRRIRRPWLRGPSPAHTSRRPRRTGPKGSCRRSCTGRR